MSSRENIPEINSTSNLQRKISSMHKLDSHIKSSLGYLQGKRQKKYVYLKIHHSLEESNNSFFKQLTQKLSEQLNDKMQLNFFNQTNELLATKYNNNELHYIIVTEKHLSWAETFARQQREESANKKKIYVFGILKKNTYQEKLKLTSKKKLEARPDYIDYFCSEDEDYPSKIANAIQEHLQFQIRQQGNRIKTWAQTNKFAGKRVKKRTLHFYYEVIMENELTGLYKAYKKKSNSSWIQIYKYDTFEDVLRKIRQRQLAVNKQTGIAKRIVTSKILKSQSQIESSSMKSFQDNIFSQLGSSILSSSIRAINKLDQDDINIIICRTNHSQLQKFRSLVRAQKYGNWLLWQINEQSPEFLKQLKEFLNQEARTIEQAQAIQLQRIITSKTLFVLCLQSDYNTIDMFRNQTNVLHNMELLQYTSVEQFSLLLREGVKSNEDFVIAVVPGGYRSFITEYGKVIAEFDAKYKNIDFVQNYKFISSVNGRHFSSITSSNAILGTQSNLTDISDNGYLQNIMRERDKNFHPLEGLKGFNVHLLIKETIYSLLDDMRQYVSKSPRLQISTYIDKEYLKRQIQTLILKDSVLVITDDTTLREAQVVVRQFDEVCILNITNRSKVKEEIKVISAGPKQAIYDLIKEIPEINQNLQQQVYQQTNQDESYYRKNRILPKKLIFRPGDTMSVRLPSQLKDIQSSKMQIRLQKYFNHQIKIQYYKEPRDIRLVNKQQQPLSFIIWADIQSSQKEDRFKKAAELDFFKDLAQNQIEELRQQFIVYSEKPNKFQQLTIKPNFERFKLASSRWERIQQYIIGTYKRFANNKYDNSEQFIYSDEIIHVFFNDKDKASKDLVATVARHRDNNQLNAANHVQFHILEDMQTVMMEQSPQHKYYTVYNEKDYKITKEQLYTFMNNKQYQNIYFKIILIRQQISQKLQQSDQRVRKVVINEGEAGQWLCSIKVLLAEFNDCTPHILIDKNSLDYYYFLDKYSRITKRFTFAYAATKEDIKQQVVSRKDVPNDQIWIIVKHQKYIREYSRLLQKTGNYQNVKFILQNREAATTSKLKIVFKNQNKKQIYKFLLNIYRRDKHIFFPSSVGSMGSIALVIMDGANGRPIAINRLQIANWKDILRAKVFNAKNFDELVELLRTLTVSMVYVVYPSIMEKAMTDLCNSYSNLKRVVLVPYPQFDSRKLKQNFVSNNNKIYIGTYGAQITEYLRNLRYNIRKSEQFLQKSIKNELIEINIQKEYKLSDQNLDYLTTKNDSVIVNRNGYELNELNHLLNRSIKYNYLPIYIGDQNSEKIISDFNIKANKNINFIDAKASPITYAMNEHNKKNCMLETNEPDELTSFLYNLPENRYEKALKNHGKFVVYYNSNDKNVSPYTNVLKSVQSRNARILLHDYPSINKIGQKKLQPGVILIHSQNQTQYQDKVHISGANYMIMSEQYNPDKNYASYGNKHFIGKHEKQFQNFMNQLAVTQQYNIEPMQATIDSPNSLIDNINKYNSSPAVNFFADLTFWPPFQPKTTYIDMNLITVELKVGVLDTNPASLMGIAFPTADLPSLPLAAEVLNKIKNSIAPRQHMILNPALDVAPSRTWFIIRSEPDQSHLLPKTIPLPKPAPTLKPNLAILLPSTPQFLAIGQMLKRNLQPDQFMVTVIGFKSQRELEQYSKNNGQRLNSYDKIVVFLSKAYRKYDNNLKIMKSKLNNRMQYFIFDDYFHVANHSILKDHLKPYRIKTYGLPFKNMDVPKSLKNCPKIAILVPSSIINNYLSLRSGHVRVIPYSDNSQIQPYLYEDDCFIIIVTLKQDYHELKMHAKSRPRCMLVIDTNQQLADDQLYLFRIPIYSLYYGPSPQSYLKGIIPSNPTAPPADNIKFLFYAGPDQQLVYQEGYDQFYKIPFRQWKDVYNYLMFTLRNKSNWLFKISPGQNQIVPLHPKVYLENKQYMKDFKNDFTQRGYLNKEKVPRKSSVVMHQFWDLPQIYYNDEKELMKQLEKQQSPSVVLFNSSNPKMGQSRNKFLKHKWIGIINNAQRWIDPQGILPDVQDERLKRKQDMFTNMFNNHVFDQFNDMQYYYLSNKANVDHARNIFFRTKEQLLSIYQNNPNLLMVVFVEDADIDHIPQVILTEASEQEGRVKLILLKINFQDDFDTLYIKYNEIDPVIKHINVIQLAGRIDFIVYNNADGQRSRQALILKHQITKVENQPYNNMMEVEQIARNIKGRYKKVYVICFAEERKEIQTIFNSYSIENKGIPNEGVEYILINRLSTIKLNPSHISNIRATKSRLQAPAQSRKSPSKLMPQNDNSERESSNTKQYKDSTTSATESHKNRGNGPSTRNKGNTQDIQITINLQKPTVANPATKMDSILVNKNFDLNIDEKLKGLFPVGKFFANKVNYFAKAKDIPTAEKGVERLIISTQATPEIIALSKQPETLVIIVGKAGSTQEKDANTLFVLEENIPSLVKKLQGSSVEGLSNIRNLDSYSKVRVVYDPKTDLESKRRLLAISQKNKKIMPTVYKNVQQLKQFMQEPDSLLMLMMSHSPEHLEEAVAQQNKVIKRKKKMKMIVPRKAEFDINGLETILQEDEGQHQNELIKTLKNDQVDFYLKIYENDEGERPQVVLDKDWQGEKEQERDENEGNDPEYVTKLNLHSNIRPQILFREEEIQNIKQRLNGDFIVVVAHSSKQKEVDDAVSKYNVLVQAYTNSMNLENDLRDKKDNVTIALIDRSMLSKIPEMKKKFPKVAFILESDNPHDQRVDPYRQFIAGQIAKVSDLQKIIGDLEQQNQRYRFNAEQMRAASRFGFKKTSVVDGSNDERLSIGAGSQRAKKTLLYFKQPDNNHLNAKFSDTFPNVGFIPYKSVADMKKIVAVNNSSPTIVIANGNDIPDIQDFASKRKEVIHIIRFNPPFDLRDNPNVKKLFTTFQRDELQKFLFDKFQRQSVGASRSRQKSREKQQPNKYLESKKYTQKYDPNTFGTTPRFPGDYIPPKSKQSTYSRKYMKSNSRSKLNNLNSRLAAIPKSPRNVDQIKE